MSPKPFSGTGRGVVVHAGPVEVQKLTLALHRQFPTPIDHLRPPGPGKRPSACAKKSRSTVSSPIFACSSWSFSRSRVLSPGSPPNTTATPSSSSFFQLVTWFGWTSYYLAISATVFSPFKASSAIRALNAGEWFRLGLRIGPAPPTGGMYSSPSTYRRVRKNRATSA